MQKIKYRISLDMLEVASQTTIKAKKGDTACSIVMTLTENGKIYHIADGCRAILSGKKADGNYLFNGETCRIEDNAIIYDFTKQTVSMEGVVQCEVVLYKGDEQLTTPRFNLLVDETVYNPDAIVSTPEADALKEFIEDSENRVNSIIEDGENLIEEVGEIHRNSNQYFANAIKGTASNVKDGVVSNDGVYITDISPLEHNINVKVDDAEATVIRNGKNLFDQSKYVTGLNNSEDQKYELKDSEGNTYFSIEYLPNEDCLCFWGELNSTHNAQAKITPNIVGEEGAYYLPSVEYVGGFIDYYGSDYNKYSNFQLICAGSTWLEVPKMKNNTVVVPSPSDIKPLPQKYITRAGFYITSGIWFDNFKIRIQLEKIEDKKGKRTDYERFVERTEHTPDADGNVLVPSAYPTTILTTDTKGVTIDAEYNVDTKAYIDNKFAELQALVLEG